LECAGVQVRSRSSLTSFEDLIVAADRGDALGPQMVQGVTAFARMLASLTVRRPIGAALDLGTGSGVQALLAARHADRVIGVDINPHALHLARVTQRINRVENVSWKEGNWFDPVRGERFDLVVSNPPFVISPDHAFLYRDSPGRADELCRQLVGASADHLAEGGFATFICDWIHEEDAWEEPVRVWVDNLGCDALLLRQTSSEPLAYATMWNRELASSDRPRFAETVKRWIRHCERIGAHWIASGAIVLRRRSAAANWTRAFDFDRGPSGGGGDQLERIFVGLDFLAAHAGAEQLRELVSNAWRLVEGHRLDQAVLYEDSSYATGKAVLVQAPGVGLNGRLDPQLLPVLLGCNGERPLGQVIEATPVPNGFDRAGFHSLCLETVKELIARGFLVGEALQGP
jgi:methylase of polypeptide subunit release factors